jgi:hypothetical protein
MIMNKLLFVFAALIFITGVNAQKGKDKGTWSKLGEATVDFKTTKATVNLATAGNYKALRIKAIDAPVHIDNLIVVYQDGAPANIPIRFDFKAGVESRSIELEDAKRAIKEVDVVYKNVTNSKVDKANIEISGLK